MVAGRRYEPDNARRLVSWFMALVLLLGQLGLPASPSFAMGGLYGPGDICSAHQDAPKQGAEDDAHGCCFGPCQPMAWAMPAPAILFTLSPPEGMVLAGAVQTSPAPIRGLGVHQPRAPPALLT